MSQRSHLVLIAVLVALAASLAWVFFGGDGADTPAAPADRPSAGAEAAAAEPRPATSLADVPTEAPAPVELRKGAESAGREVLEDTQARAASLADPDAVRWVEGRVAFPAGSPPDSTLKVLALAEEVPGHRRHGFFDRADTLRPSESEELWSIAEVEADGFFRAAFPRDASEGWLEVSARYLYLPASERVDLASAGTVELAPQLGGCVRGDLTAPPGALAPLGDVEVELGVDELSAIFESGRGLGNMEQLAESFRPRRVRTTSAGHFEFRAVPPAAALRVRAKPETLALGEVGDVEVTPGRVTETTVDLTLGATLAGRVVDEMGRPVAGAEVRAHETRAAFGMSFPADKMRETDSDDEGGFELPGIAAGAVKLVVEKDGYIESTGESFEVADGEVRRDLELVLERGLSISGTVHLPDGNPAVGADVTAKRDMSDLLSGGFGGLRGMEGHAKTDAEGRFEVAALGDAAFRLRVTWEEEREVGDDLEYFHVAEKVRPGGDPLAIVLDPPLVLTGRVVDEDGNPIPEFRLRADMRSEVAFLPSSDSDERSFQNEDGTFEWTELYAGAWTITATAEGFSPSPEIEVVLPGEGLAPLELVLPRSARVAGRVVDPRGTPVANATVSLDLDLMQTMASRMGRSEFPEAQSDADGRFEIEVAPGEQSLVASHDDWADSVPAVVDGTSGGEVGDIELALRNGGLLTGEIYDKDGELTAGAQIIVQHPGGTGQRFARSDAEGFFRFEHMTPGNWQLVGMPAEGEATDIVGGDEGFDIGEMMSNMRIAMVDVEDGGEHHVLLGAPPEDPVLVRGQVQASGEPLPEVMISFFAAERSDAMSSLRMTQADEDGRFEFQLNEPGDYVINVQQLVNFTGQQQTVEFREKIPAEEVYELDLVMPGGAIRGRVYAANGKPAANTRVSLTGADGTTYGTFFGGQYSDVQTDENGDYELLFLRPGTYSVGAGGVFFGGAFGGDSPDGRTVISGIRVAEGQAVEGVDFHLTGSGKVRGTVRDTAGQPVAEAAIFLRNEGGALLELFSMVTTDGSGRFEYVGVAEGRYTVTARTEDLVTERSVAVEVEAGETTDVDIPVGNGTTVFVTLVDKSGAEVEARVRVRDPEGREWSGMMSMQTLMELMQGGVETTEQRIGPLAPGTYEVSATTADGRTAKKSVTLGSRAQRKVKLRLRN